MRKIIFVLTLLLLVSPVLARFEITCTVVDDEVTVRYDRSGGDANLPRAFGLDITLDNDANIVSTSNFNPKFWVHPGSIDVNTTTDVVDSNGTPILSDVNYPQAGGLVGPPDSNGMTIEMGSLYEKGVDPNTEPNGVLFKFIVDADCNVAIAGNTALGKVVLEDTKEDNTNYGSGCTVTGLGALCPGDVTGTVKGLTTGPPPNNVKTFDANTWTGPDGKVDTSDVQALIYLLQYDGVALIVSPVHDYAEAGDVTGTVKGLTTGPPPNNIKTFDANTWTGPDGKIDTSDVQALIYLLQYDGTALLYTCP